MYHLDREANDVLRGSLTDFTSQLTDAHERIHELEADATFNAAALQQSRTNTASAGMFDTCPDAPLS